MLEILSQYFHLPRVLELDGKTVGHNLLEKVIQDGARIGPRKISHW